MNNQFVFGDSRLPGRFWSKVRIAESGCWEWVGALNKPNGYGVYWDGRQIYAHRGAYIALVGGIENGMVIDHLCRNRKCANPSHLEVVSNWENTLRGENPIGSQPNRTRCPKGHPYDLLNTRYKRRQNANIERVCRACEAAYNKTRPNRQSRPTRTVTVERVKP